MRLFHAGSRPAQRGPLTVTDEEDCYTSAGHRRGIWLTSEPLSGPSSRSIELPAGVVQPFEVTAPGDAHRTFVVPANDIGSFPYQPGAEAAS